MLETKVLIVGLGPTGMMLANEMLKHNINFLIIDKRKAISDLPRAVNLTPASLSLLKLSTGLDIFNKTIQTDLIKVHWNNKLITRISYAFKRFPYKKFCYLPQPFLEKILYQQIKTRKENILEEAELVAIKKINKNEYLVDLNSKNSTEPVSVKCQYLVGCDGTNSIVRQWAKISNEEEDYRSNFFLYDIEVEEKPNIHDSNYYVFEHGYIIIVPITSKQYRIILSSNKLENNENFKYENLNFLNSFIRKYCKISIKIKKIIWFTTSGFKHRIATSACNQNCFIAGDAFHVFSPVGGLNMNAGLHDAVNLGWKLAYTIKGYASKKILKSYENERKIVVKAIRDKTKHLTQVMVKAKTYSPARDYIGTFSNRISLKQQLPGMLSGYDSYNNLKNPQEIIPFNTGYHISEFISKKSTYFHMCNSLSKQKFNLLANKNICIDKKYSNFLNSVRIDEFDFKKHFLLLRPDGYIEIIDSLNNFSKLLDYLIKYLGGKQV